eukprot:scaffold211126_cov37-Tisochrysis_lutea.AAC.1
MNEACAPSDGRYGAGACEYGRNTDVCGLCKYIRGLQHPGRASNTAKYMCFWPLAKYGKYVGRSNRGDF